MNLRKTIPLMAVAALMSASGCSVITRLMGAGGADASAFTVDMERYDIRSIDLRPADPRRRPGPTRAARWT